MRIEGESRVATGENETQLVIFNIAGVITETAARRVGSVLFESAGKFFETGVLASKLADTVNGFEPAPLKSARHADSAAPLRGARSRARR